MVLNILEPTADMYVDSLIALASGNVSAVHMKETMALICKLGIEGHDLSSLSKVKFLPVRFANGETSFTSAASSDESLEFVITENLVHRDTFRGKIVMLDFSIEEVRNARPILLTMALGEWFSSRLVKEMINVKGGFLDQGMTRELRRKSQAIVRWVTHLLILKATANCTNVLSC